MQSSFLGLRNINNALTFSLWEIIYLVQLKERHFNLALQYVAVNICAIFIHTSKLCILTTESACFHINLLAPELFF